MCLYRSHARNDLTLNSSFVMTTAVGLIELDCCTFSRAQPSRDSCGQQGHTCAPWLLLKMQPSQVREPSSMVMAPVWRPELVVKLVSVMVK